jgi:NADPH:quinone reductase-like Zn-dependent oxidoreductase
MRIERFTAPMPGNREVMIEVKACGVNFPDLVVRLGLHPHGPRLPSDLPYVPGCEVAGRILQVGREVVNFRPGDRVFAMLECGGYATHVVCPESRLFRIPPDMPDNEASVIATSYLAAWISVERLASVRAGEHVVIHSAGGGVGLAALQLCTFRGARVIAIASRKKHKRLLFIGADVCIDPRTENLAERLRELTTGKGVDVVLDSTGGASYQRSYNSLSTLGRLVMLGSAGEVTETVPSAEKLARFEQAPMHVEPMGLMAANRSISGLHLPALWSRQEVCIQGIAEIISLYEAGQIMPIIDSVFSLKDAAKAHRRLHARRNFGKVVLRP